MRVYIVRHGESETNRDGKWTGWLNVRLTDKGREDAKKAGKILAGVKFDKIYASDLDRAKETAQNAIPGCTLEENKLIREINVGNIAGKPLDVIGDEERKLIAKNGYADFDGETYEVFRQRVTDFMKILEECDGENIAVFSHAGWLRAFLNAVTGTVIPRNNLLCDNCTVGIFEYKEGTWMLHSWINLD